MRPHQRWLAIVVVTVLQSVIPAHTLTATDYPARPITLIVPWPAGGSTDGLGRVLAPKLSQRLGKPVIIENRPGAGSIAGIAAVARANPDGYTLGLAGSGSLAINVAIHKRLSYDPVTDIVPLALVAHIPFVLVAHSSLQLRTVSDLAVLSKERAGQLSYASSGSGSPPHLYAELLKRLMGIEMLHVPYKGTAPALMDVVGGHVSLMFADPLPALSQIREGNVRALGVSSLTRWSVAPDIPTIAEQGVPDFSAVAWAMVVAPANTPENIAMRLHADLNTILGVPEVHQELANHGAIPTPSKSPQELRNFISSEIERWGKVVRQVGLAGAQ